MLAVVDILRNTMAMKDVDMETAVSISNITADAVPSFGNGMRKYFQFDEDWINLNHGNTLPPSLTSLD